MNGRFISFEGGEGSGKTTQAAALYRRLNAAGIKTILTREPGGSPRAEQIRTVLLSGAAEGLGPDGEALLFAAARADHLDQVIKPALQSGEWVVCDRFVDSTRVYQGVVGGADLAFIKALEKVTVGDCYPDLTLILDVPADIGLRRAELRRGDVAADRFEVKDLAYHTALASAFRAISDEEPERCLRIDANRTTDEVAAEIWTVLRDRLSPHSAERAS